jgi:hypothetical protein
MRTYCRKKATSSSPAPAHSSKRNQSGALLEAAASRMLELIHNNQADEPRKNNWESRLADDRGKEILRSMRSGRPIGAELCTGDSLCQVELSRLSYPHSNVPRSMTVWRCISSGTSGDSAGMRAYHRGFTGAPTFTPVQVWAFITYDAKTRAPICLDPRSRGLVAY